MPSLSEPIDHATVNEETSLSFLQRLLLGLGAAGSVAANTESGQSAVGMSSLKVLQDAHNGSNSGAKVTVDHAVVTKEYDMAPHENIKIIWDSFMTKAVSKISKLPHAGFRVPEFLGFEVDDHTKIKTEFAGPTVNNAAAKLVGQPRDKVVTFLQALRDAIKTSVQAFSAQGVANGDLALRDMFWESGAENPLIIGDWGNLDSVAPLQYAFLKDPSNPSASEKSKAIEKAEKYYQACHFPFGSMSDRSTWFPFTKLQESQQSDEDHVDLWCNGYNLLDVDWDFYNQRNTQPRSFPHPAENLLALQFMAEGSLKGLLVPNDAMLAQACEMGLESPSSSVWDPWVEAGTTLSPEQKAFVRNQDLNPDHYNIIPLHTLQNFNVEPLQNPELFRAALAAAEQ